MSCNENKPLRVVWICHLTNKEIQSQLSLNPRFSYRESQPWIANTLSIFNDDPLVKLYVVSPHNGLQSFFQKIEIGSVTCVYFRPFGYMYDNMKVNWVNRKVRAIINICFPINELFDFPVNSFRIKKIIKEINPDIIQLQGAENPLYSSSILGLKEKYPILVTIAGFISHTLDKSSKTVRHQMKVEKKIIERFLHFSVQTKQMANDLLMYNRAARLHWLYYKIRDLSPHLVKKEFDLVYFARICRDKGIEDLIKALAMIKRERSSTTLLVIGTGSVNYKEYLKSLANSLSVSTLITWAGFLPTQDDVHSMASKAKVSVLPTMHDCIPGTIIESMLLGLPVAAYATGSIPELNEEIENVLLSERGDVNGLAENILRLLNDDELYYTFSQRGISCIRERYFSMNLHQQYLSCYTEVISDFHKNE